ncbi:MAG: glycosyltransferase family 8 protein [Clostridiaceae bacterium]
MNVVYSSSDSYAEIAGISMLSLFETNREAGWIRVFILDNGISEQNRARLNETARAFAREIVFLPPPDLEQTLGLRVETYKWNIGTFYRLFLCSVLPQSVERLIYLDCDTIVRGSLAPLWTLDLKGCSMAAVDDTRADAYKLELGLNTSDTYTNNGVMLVDLAKWRAEGIERLFIEKLVERKGKLPFVDQGVLNAVLSRRKKVLVLPPRCNAMTFLFYFSYPELLRFRRPSSPYLTREEFEEARVNPLIVHFFPCFMAGTRPWNEKDTHPFTPEYRACKARSPWKDAPYRADERSAPRKLFTVVCNVLPRPIMLFFVSLLHAQLLPFFRKAAAWIKKKT